MIGWQMQPDYGRDGDSMTDRIAVLVRRGVVSLLSCAGIVVAMQLLFSGVLVMDWPIWYQDPLELVRRYLVVPWSFTLGVLCLYERNQRQEKTNIRYVLLTLLLLWIIVPFCVRFGFTFNNVTSWSNAFIAFVSVYIMTNWHDLETRERDLNVVCLCMLLISLVWGGLLLLCAATAQAIEIGAGGYVFGVSIQKQGCLTSGMHYNNTGMLAVCLYYMNLAGSARCKKKLCKAMFGIAAAMMVVVTVLTQSRTARYSLLIATAIMAFGWLFGYLHKKSLLMRSVASAGLAAVILVGGYLAADELTNAAMQSYTEQGVMTKALAEEQEESEKAVNNDVFVVRGAGEMSFTGRTTFWKNALNYWKENPKYLLIGLGVGGFSKYAAGGNGAVGYMLHNAYLQIVADYGLIGALLYAGFMVLMIRPVVGSLFAVMGRAGHRALAAMVVACLVTGFMESIPLAPLSAMNLMMMYALAHLSGEDKQN